MRLPGSSTWTVSVLVLLLSLSVCCLNARAQPRPGRRGLSGDWRVQMEVGGRTWDSILSFSRGRENRNGQWISFWGVTALQDLRYEDGTLSFAQTRTGRDGQTFESKFSGTIEDGKLTGTLTSERGEVKVTATREPRMPRAAGSWETKFKVGDREITNKLVINVDKEGKLSVDWQSERVQHEISEVNYERGQLSFLAKSKLDDRQWESRVEVTFRGDEYSGVMKSERGETALAGTRIGAPLVGVWNLDVSTERGERKQRLRVFPNMSALYGATPVDKVTFADGKVSFKVSRQFGDRTFELTFDGKVDGARLTGEVTSERGARKVSGEKVERSGGERRRRQPTAL